MPGTQSPTVTVEPDYCVLSRRSDSFGRRSRWMVFASLCAVSFVMAIVFAILGAWLVMPYSVLEMGVVFWAFRWYERRAADWEQLTVIGDRVIVERVQAGVRTTRQFNRLWVQVEYDPQRAGATPSLGLRYAGQTVSFGADLPAAERARLARELKRLLGRQAPVQGVRPADR
jgi:uncharacterized membrane protein